MFTIEYRQEVRESIISKARGNPKIVSAAVIGSYASGEVDRWSDIDLTFGVDESFSINSMLEWWTEYIIKEFAGIMLFDVKQENTTYRVFILPGCLQVDLSFSPASQFGAVGSHFKLLYGKKYEKPQTSPLSTPQTTKDQFGYMVHHILRARFCMERNGLAKAEFWISEARNYALKLASKSQSIRDSFKDSYVKELSKEEIMKAIRVIVSQIPNISEEVKGYSLKLSDALNELSSEI